jgi:heptosyltransferase-3
MLTPLLQELEHIFPDATIDLVVKGGLANSLFKQFTNIGYIHQLPKRPFKTPMKYIKQYLKIRSHVYDLVINPVEGSNSATLITKQVNARYKSFGQLDNVYWGDQHQASHMAMKPVLALRYMTGQGRVRKMPLLDIRLTGDERIKGQQQVRQLCPTINPVIALFTYATGQKLHSKQWWIQLYTQITETFPGHQIIEILPLENSSQIDFKAPSIYTTDVRALAAVLSACDVLVAADSGVMHLSSAVNTPTLGLFNVTDSQTYRPYNELSQAIHTTNTATNEVINQIRFVLEHQHKSLPTSSAA